jgi:hypothetical protein
MEIQQIYKNRTFKLCHAKVSHKNNINQYKKTAEINFMILFLVEKEN